MKCRCIAGYIIQVLSILENTIYYEKVQYYIQETNKVKTKNYAKLTF